VIQTSRNSPCPCGSGKKYKHRCGTPQKATTATATRESEFMRLVNSALGAHHQQQFDLAERLYGQALQIRPRDPGLLGLVGMAAYQQGRNKEALERIRVAIALEPNDARLHNYLAQVLDAEKRHQEAQIEFVKAVRLEPGYVEAWYNAGISLLHQGDPTEGGRALAQALRLAPEDEQIRLGLLEALYLERRLENAEHLALQMDAAANGSRELITLWRSAIHSAQGQKERAHELETKLEHVDSERLFTALMAVGRVAVIAGNMEEGERWLKWAIRLKPEAPAPYIELATSRKFTETDNAFVEQMNVLLTACPDDERHKLEFALGKVLTDLGNYDDSFIHYKAANDLIRKRIPDDEQALISRIDRTMEIFSKESFEALPHGCDSTVPILIVGTPRSGTTLTEQIISSHSKIAGGGELVYWSRVAPLVIDVSNTFTQELAERMSMEYLTLMRQVSRAAEHVTDKMPGNYEILGLIHTVFPNARIVHCRRHPVDACLSMYFQNFNYDHAYKFSLEGLAAMYEQYVRLMDHWRSVLPAGTMFETWYEDLVEDAERKSRELMDFLGLEWEESQLDFYKKERPVFTCSKWQVRQPIYKTSKERWRRYEEHLGPLLPLLKYAPH
jgi:tetratricopeptide (TPR) repeat protein